MLVAAAVCPHPPVLVPEVAQGAAPELDDLRLACDEAVDTLFAARPDRVVVVASGNARRRHSAFAIGSLAPYGVDLVVGATDALDGGALLATDDRLGLGHTIGAWLLDRHEARHADGGAVTRSYVETDGAAVGTSGRTALLVMADGTAKRSTEAPGYLDERAAAYDEAIGRALAAGDPAALAGLDSALGRSLWVHGVPALRSLGHTVRSDARSAALTARLTYDAAPYGVGYFVAAWLAEAS